MRLPFIHFRQLSTFTRVRFSVTIEEYEILSFRDIVSSYLELLLRKRLIEHAL